MSESCEMSRWIESGSGFHPGSNEMTHDCNETGGLTCNRLADVHDPHFKLMKVRFQDEIAASSPVLLQELNTNGVLLVASSSLAIAAPSCWLQSCSTNCISRGATAL